MFLRGTLPILVLLLGGLTAANPEDESVRADETLLKEHQVGVDGPSLLEFFRQRTLTDTAGRQLEQLVRQLGHDSYHLREQAGRELVRRGPSALPLLRPALKDRDLEVVRRAEQCIADIEQGPGPGLPMAVARLLVQRQPPGALEALLGYLPFAGDDGIEDEILSDLLVLAARQERPDPALIAAGKDRQPLRRAAAGYLLGRLKVREQRALVLPLLADPDARVRLRAAQGLAVGGAQESVPVLIALLADPSSEVAWRAEDTLQRLAGANAPAPAADAANAEAQGAWRDAWGRWWKENGERVDFARLARGPEQLGLTLFIEWNTKQVYECGRDGKPRWALTVDGPLDAEILPGNRVLIAEANSKRVTERDLKGNVLWEFKVEGEPLNCRRLPNGNTFVGTRKSVLEVTRDGRILFKHQVAGEAYLHAVSRLRNGHYLYITSTGLIAELNAAGKQVRSVQLAQEGSWGDVEALPGGRYLVANYGTGKVLEVDAAGKVVWERSVTGACGVSRLSNGNTLLGCSDRVVEIDRVGKVLWEKTSAGFVRRAHQR